MAEHTNAPVFAHSHVALVVALVVALCVDSCSILASVVTPLVGALNRARVRFGVFCDLWLFETRVVRFGNSQIIYNVFIFL